MHIILPTIRDYICQLDSSDDFHSLYMKYVAKMQDACIQSEFDYMLKHNVVDVALVDRAIQSSIESWVSHG